MSEYVSTYYSKLGEMLLAADESGVTGVWFTGQKYYGAGLTGKAVYKRTDDLICAVEWLDVYFSGKNPNFMPRLHLKGTPFRKEVWQKLLDIPYGETITYGDLASRIAFERNIEKMSPRAVGAAVGHNPVSIIVPCHRVLGYSGKIVGYAGGVERKKALLKIENVL